MMSNNKVSILIVNGGKDPENGRWIKLCLDKIVEHTEWQNYHIYVWNNNVTDQLVIDFLQDLPIVTLVQANPSEKLAHIHAVPLQRLYELTRQKDNPKYIVTMDSDAHPIQRGWLTKLISSLSDEVVVAGVWRDELKKAIKPYIHASCLCTTVDFIENNKLRLDFIAPNTETERHDTLSILTETAEQRNLKAFKLHRSNKNNFHRLLGGIYGNLIYHHGAGSRKGISFWDEESTEFTQIKYEKMGEMAANLLLNDCGNYISWLQGNIQDKSFESKMMQLHKIEVVSPDLHKSSKQTARRSITQKLSFRSEFKKLFKMLPGIAKLRNLLRQSPPPKTNIKQEESPNFSYMLRPFTIGDLRPVPAGWNVGGPDFVGVGTPKAGTSWWYFLLKEHPQIVGHRLFSENIPVSKELHYFLHFKIKGIDRENIATYRQAFAVPDGAICGEWSTPYLCHPLCLEYLAQAAPNTKILVLLRNPIDRLVSHLNHVIVNRARYFGLNSEQCYLFEIYSAYPEAALHSFYARGLRQLLKYFDRSQILVLQYEKCKANPLEEIAKTYRFLGVDERYQPQQIQQSVNRQNYLISPLEAEERQRLAGYFADDIRDTTEMFPEIELALWPDFCN